MSLLGVDVGTTRCKAAVFDRRGSLLAHATRLTAAGRTSEGYPFYDPEQLWRTVAETIEEAVSRTGDDSVEVVGVAGMAEAGLLVDRETGETRCHIIPWYDNRSAEQAERLTRAESSDEGFARSGLHRSVKYGLTKILWLADRYPGIPEGAIWLSVPDYIVYRLTGSRATDPTLAVRTYAYRLMDGHWDHDWLHRVGLTPDLFPPVLPSGRPAGQVTVRSAEMTGVPAGTPAAVSGHDHLCAMLAAGALHPGTVLDSVGTAESMLGVMPSADLGRRERESGLSIAPHVLPGAYCWLGGLPSAGGAIEWLRAQLEAQSLSYDQVMALVLGIEGPTGILYFPYLLGSGSPCHDDTVRAAFVGLQPEHGRGHILKAALEGTAYEAEWIRRSAQGLTGATIDQIVVVGGGAKNPAWVQIRADVTGCTCLVPELEEATAQGAALIAALGAGTLKSLSELEEIVEGQRRAAPSVEPNPDRHRAYRALFESGYLPLQGPLRETSDRLHGLRRQGIVGAVQDAGGTAR